MDVYPSRHLEDVEVQSPKGLEEYLMDYLSTNSVFRDSAKYQDVFDYFTTTDKKSGYTPLQELAHILADLPEPKDPDGRLRFASACQKYAEILLKNLWRQHHENSPNYSSHGCDHSLAVAHNMDLIWEQFGEQLMPAMQKLYGLGPEQARFLSYHAALLHDCGYADLNDGQGNKKGKSTHPIYSYTATKKLHQSAVLDDVLFFDGVMTDVHKKELLAAIERAVFYHGSDRIEHHFPIKLTSDSIALLVNSPDHLKLVAEECAELAMPISSIAASSEDIACAIKNLLDWPFEVQKLQSAPGRRVDFKTEGDKLAGLEYSIVDLHTDPFGFLIRLADNMHADENRLTAAQHHPLTMQFCKYIGDEGPISQALEKMHSIVGEYKYQKNTQFVHELEVDRFYITNKNKLLWSLKNALDVLDQEFGMEFSKEILWSDGFIPDIETKFRQILFRYLLEDFESRNGTIDTKMKPIISQICLETPPDTYLNWAGLESDKEVTMRNQEIWLTVNDQVFANHNETRVFKKIDIFEASGEIQEQKVEVGAGEFQIFRIRHALQSIFVGGEKIKLRVFNEAGREFRAHFQAQMS